MSFFWAKNSFFVIHKKVLIKDSTICIKYILKLHILNLKITKKQLSVKIIFKKIIFKQFIFLKD